MKLIDLKYLATPFYGARKIAVWLKGQGHRVNRKRVRRLMRIMGLRAIYRRPRTSQPAPGHKVLPLPAEWHEDNASQPGVGGGHHLHPYGVGIPVPGWPS
jgi:putative transposase